jgi:hypothetical protein
VNIKNAKKWAEALRSGKYEQCRNKMTHGGRYCCLGVAHEVLIGPVGVEVRGSYEAVDAILGLTEMEETYFVTWNDKDGKNFAQIADLIDEKLATHTSKVDAP